MTSCEEMGQPLVFSRVLFALCPTGLYCREDRCQSYFNFELIPSVRAPLEECQGAAGVRKAGGEAAIIDAPVERLNDEAFLAKIYQFSPQLIVLAVTFGSLEDDLLWTTRLRREFPEVTIALRGAPCYVWARDILRRCAAVDICVRGDYEIVFEELAALGRAARGLTYRSGSTTEDVKDAFTERSAPLAKDLDSLPFPDRSSINQELYTVRGSKYPQATIHVQRGCPFPCTFCLVHTVSGNKARHRSPASIVAEMQSLLGEGISHFYLRAETFSLDKRWVVELCDAIATYCPTAKWVTATRVECVDEEVIAAMRAAGCYGISFGVDVASEEIGRRVKKPPRLQDAERAMRLCDRHKIVSLAYIMIGFIWDTPSTIAEAQRFIRAIRPDLLTVHFAHPYPGTAYYDAVQQAGISVTSLLAQATPALDAPEISSSSIRYEARKMLLRHYSRPKVLWSLARKLVMQKISYSWRSRYLGSQNYRISTASRHEPTASESANLESRL